MRLEQDEQDRGGAVVWTIRRGKVTHGLSELHRYMGGGLTFCQKKIPADPKRIVETSLIAVPECDRCKVLSESGASVADVLKQVVADAMERVRGVA